MKTALIAWAFLAGPFTSYVHAHTRVWSVWINGVDQGTGFGIRDPGYNGPPLNADRGNFGQGSGYSTSPVRDLNSVDMKCNVFGDEQNPYTHKVVPGDVVTFEWHHETKTSGDDIIDGSHHGAGVVYISPDPPWENSWVKIQEEAQQGGGWYVTGKLRTANGKQNVRIPAGLAPGHYLLRAELITLHEADATHLTNPNRGVQLYPACVQIEVTGSGNVTLPVGVSFPGAYKYTDPGIVYNLYGGSAGAYIIPGPPVWSGAAASPAAPNFGSPIGITTASRWSSWIGSSSRVTKVLATNSQGQVLSSTIYNTVAQWSTTYKTPAVPVTPTSEPSSTSVSVVVPTSSNNSPVSSNPPQITSPSLSPSPTSGGQQQKWGQCGGIGWRGPTTCVSGSSCNKLNDYYSQCQ